MPWSATWPVHGVDLREWSKALPPLAIVRLVAARVLRERGDADAERAIDAVVAEADAPTEPGPGLALHLAAQAEAFALRSQWKDAEERYQRAVELMPDDSIRRSWYVNLADLDLRLNDEPKRRRALEAARGLSRNDEISRRVNDLLKAFGGRAEITGAAHPGRETLRSRTTRLPRASPMRPGSDSPPQGRPRCRPRP